MDPTLAFHAVIPRLYRRGIKSHTIGKIAKILGIRISSKTTLRILRACGKISPGKVRVGSWAKRHGSARDFSWDRKFWKNRMTSPQLVRIAKAFAAWYSYAQSGGEMDLDAIAAGDKPP